MDEDLQHLETIVDDLKLRILDCMWTPMQNLYALRKYAATQDDCPAGLIESIDRTIATFEKLERLIVVNHE